MSVTDKPTIEEIIKSSQGIQHFQKHANRMDKVKKGAYLNALELKFAAIDIADAQLEKSREIFDWIDQNPSVTIEDVSDYKDQIPIPKIHAVLKFYDEKYPGVGGKATVVIYSKELGTNPTKLELAEKIYDAIKDLEKKGPNKGEFRPPPSGLQL